MSDPRALVWLVAMLLATLTPLALLWGADWRWVAVAVAWQLAVSTWMAWLMRKAG